MSGEELNRKYHELCGLEEIENVGGHWMFLDRSLALTAGGRWHSRLPLLHLDASLAITEAQKALSWFRITVEPQRAVFVRLDIAVEAVGQNAVCEAILLALIAAKERL